MKLNTLTVTLCIQAVVSLKAISWKYLLISRQLLHATIQVLHLIFLSTCKLAAAPECVNRLDHVVRLPPAQVVISPSSCRTVQSDSIQKHMSLTSGDSQVELLPSFNPIKDVRYSLKSRSITLTICLVPCNYTVLLDTCKPVPQACSSFVPATVFRSTTVSQNYKQWQWTIDLTTQPQQPSSGQQTLICRQHHHLPE